MADGAETVGLGDEHHIDEHYVGGYFRDYVLHGGAHRTVLAILADPYRLDWCRWQSYQHHNQFDKVVLGSSALDGRKLVWHRWHVADELADAEMHNHRWDFVSYVISGVLAAVDYEIDGHGALERERYRYHSPGESEEYSMEHLGRSRLAVVRRNSYGSGDFYFQPHQVIHAATAAEPNTSTLIVQGPVRSGETVVFPVASAGRDGAEVIQREVERYSEAEFVRLLQELATQLDP